MTSWGFLAVCFYFTVLSVLAIKHAVDTKVNTLRSKSPPIPFDAHTSQHFSSFTKFCYHLALSMQPFVVVGYWILDFPTKTAPPDGGLTCGYTCIFRHGVAFILTFSELWLTDLPFDKLLLKKVVAVPMPGWLLLQIVWVYGIDGKPCYKVLQLDDALSVGVIVGVTLFFIGTFKLSSALTGVRDKRRGNVVESVESDVPSEELKELGGGSMNV